MNEKEVNAPKKKHTGKIVLVGLLIACVVIYFAVPSVHTWINNVVAMFKSGDFDQMRNFIAKYGKWAMLVSAFLMVFQSIAAPLPAFFITLTNADIVSYAAGLTAMDFGGFMLATGLGQLPASIVYSYVGGMLTGGAQKLFIGLLCLFALAILVTLIRQVWMANHKEV